MGWRQDGKYYYTTRTLRTIAENYPGIYQGIELSWQYETTNMWDIAEYKADFVNAFNSIGKGHWDGNWSPSLKFKDFDKFGKLQRAVITEILGIDDKDLTILGFTDTIYLHDGSIWKKNNIARLRGYAYHCMKTWLNSSVINTDEES